MKKNNKGFTLVEILAVIVILGIIMIVALPTYSSVYNSIRLSTHLNNIKTIKNAALDYGSNTGVKDEIKKLHDSSKKNLSNSSSINDWCKVISITNLIKAGYLSSDDDNLNQITDVFTGSAMGYNLQNNYNSSSPKDGVALCYCKDKLDIDAFVIKDLDRYQVYHSGEYVRNFIADESTGNSTTVYEFRELKVSFIYNDAFNKIVKARNKATVDIEGEKVDINGAFSGITGDFSLSNDAVVKKVNELIFRDLTNNPTC
ncbi:MAG: type II secretion system GspH family protein [Bacilli bacterium]|nr:type II secretion system GspH family protein [Bacilli bacterium]